MRRVLFALVGEAVLFAVLIFWVGSGSAGFAAGQGALGVFVSVLIVGFPSLYYCCQRGVWDAWRFVLLGALGGLLCALPLYGGPHPFVFLMVLLVFAGAGFGGLFWVSAIWRNRDLTCPKSFCLPCGMVYKVARTALRRSASKSQSK